MSSDSLSEVYESGQTRLSNVDNLRERSLAAIITVFVLMGLVLMGSPAGAVSTTLAGPTDDVDLNDNDDVTLTYEIEIEQGERIQIGGYEFEITDDNGDSTTVEATGSHPTDSDLSVGSDNSNEIDISTSDLSISTDFSEVQSQFGYGYLSGYDRATGYDAFGYGYGDGYGYGYSAGSDNTISVTLTIDGDAFNSGEDYTAVAQVDTDGSGSTAFGDNSAAFTVVDSSSGPSGPSGPSGSSSSSTADDADEEDDVDETDDEESDTPTVADVRNELDQIEPNTQTTTEIVDSDPDRPGVNVRPEGTESVREITFSDEGASGNVDVREWQDPPQSVSQSVTGAIRAESGEDTETSANVVTVADIDPDSDEVRGASATVEMTVDSDRLDTPEDAVISHERGDSWEQLETSVEETSDGEVTLVAETDSFSLFAVAEVTETTATDTDEPAEPTDEGDDGLGTTGLVGLLVLLLLIVGAAVGYRQMQ